MSPATGVSTASLGGSQNQHWATDTTAYGRKMLEKMGWNDGDGLGKDKQGEKTFVRVKKRTDNLGLGQESYSSVKGGGPNGVANRIDAAAGAKGWAQTNDNFAGVLAGLAATYGSEHKKKKKKRDKKKARKRKREGNDEEDSDVDEQAIGKAERHALSAFASRKKHIRSKNVSRLSEKDLACLLGGIPSGGSPFAAAEPAKKKNKKDKKDKKDKKAKKDKKDKKDKKEVAVEVEVVASSDAVEEKKKDKKAKKKKKKSKKSKD